MKPYHPNFFDSTSKVIRPRCEDRLKLIKPHVHGSVLDLGCNEGYFSFGVMDVATKVTGVDHKKASIELCHAHQRHLTSGRVEFVTAKLEDFIVDIDQEFDTTLYLSVHHHIMKQKGFQEAAKLLHFILLNTRDSLIFDIGQKDEKHPRSCKWWGILPDGDPDEWVRGLLKAAGATGIEKIGYSTFAGARRGLWRASR